MRELLLKQAPTISLEPFGLTPISQPPPLVEA